MPHDPHTRREAPTDRAPLAQSHHHGSDDTINDTSRFPRGEAVLITVVGVLFAIQVVLAAVLIVALLTGWGRS